MSIAHALTYNEELPLEDFDYDPEEARIHIVNVTTKNGVMMSMEFSNEDAAINAFDKLTKKNWFKETTVKRFHAVLVAEHHTKGVN